MEKIKILGIAPYQEMEPLMRDIAKSYENLELYTFTGFYKNAIQFAKAFPDKEFDVIISRGGTADLVRSLNDTPVVEIKVSTLDLLRVITQALQCSSRAAVVSYPYITARVETLAKFLRLNIRTFSFETPEQIEDTVKQCARAGYDLIVGGAATRDYAVAEGAQFLLITSSRESVEASIRQAIEQHHLINDVLDKNRLFQSVIDKSGSAVFIFGEQRELQYTNVAARKMLNDVERMEQFLSRGISTLQDAGTLHLIKKLNNDFYEITGGILQVRQEIRYLFEVHFRAAGYRVSSFAKLEDPEDILNCGIEIKVQPPGKALKVLSLLSGGEKAFVAIALYFAILKVRPTPFVVMDEIEAALDDNNVVRFARYMRSMSDKTQFIVITHRRGTMEEADILYGVTMQEQGVSRMLTINLNDVEKELNIR